MPAPGTSMSAEQRALRRDIAARKRAERTHKLCPRCNEALPVEAFGERSSSPGRLNAYCRTCRLEVGRKSAAAWRARHPEAARAKQRRTDLRIRFGITPEDYDRRLIEQHGRCAICRTTDPGGLKEYFAVDHNHDTGEVRGLLCSDCNVGLGQLGDDPARLRAAANYLEQHLAAGNPSRVNAEPST